MKNFCLTSSEIEQRLQEAGVNATAQRIAICRFVLCEADHPTVDTIKEWADNNFPKMSLATVYNTMHILEEAGLVRSFQFPHTDKVIYDHTTSDHYHLYDEKSQKIIDVPLDAVEFKATFTKSFDVRSASIVFYGKKK